MDFVEMLLLLSNFDVCLQENVIDCMKQSKMAHEAERGEGSYNMQVQGFYCIAKQFHVWCYVHVLNLVLTGTTEVIVESASVLLLSNDVAVFIWRLYKHMHLGKIVRETDGFIQ